jgi:predicted HAD superfamily Cof-like phosphohydrolase
VRVVDQHRRPVDREHVRAQPGPLVEPAAEVGLGQDEGVPREPGEERQPLMDERRAEPAVGDVLDPVDLALREPELRAKLIMEEAIETVAAMGFSAWAVIEQNGQPGVDPHKRIASFHKSFDKPDFDETIDGLADLLYVVYGAAVTFGIDLDPFFDEVHRSNMAKDGGATREDGKILKPEGWQPPAIRAIREDQESAAAIWLQLGVEASTDPLIEVITQNGGRQRT